MSHNTTIDEIVFTDIDALKMAVTDLNKLGIKSSLIENAVPRAYSHGQLKQAPYVLKLENGQYDVGFYYDKAKKGYVAMADFYAGYVADQLGAKTGKGESAAQGQMGKLFNAYAVNAATRQAIRQGYSVRRVNKQDGGVQLIMTGIRV